MSARNTEENDEEIRFPYKIETTDKIKHVLRNDNIKTVFTTRTEFKKSQRQIYLKNKGIWMQEETNIKQHGESTFKNDTQNKFRIHKNNSRIQISHHKVSPGSSKVRERLDCFHR